MSPKKKNLDLLLHPHLPDIPLFSCALIGLRHMAWQTKSCSARKIGPALFYLFRSLGKAVGRISSYLANCRPGLVLATCRLSNAMVMPARAPRHSSGTLHR